ncbi:MAG: hypothetical protein L0221_13665 [Chloroflexi bacterium]|nr:hypothetical protein [Chloroflexota bacterium]
MRLARIALLLVLAGSVAGCGLTQSDRAEPRVAPPGALPPPYDFAGVRDTVAGRGMTISMPTVAEVGQAATSPQAFVRDLPATVTETYPDEAARAVSVYVVIVDSDNERLPIDHRLSYVVETTGHATGNCLDFFDANTGDVYLAACFFPARSSP